MLLFIKVVNMFIVIGAFIGNHIIRNRRRKDLIGRKGAIMGYIACIILMIVPLLVNAAINYFMGTNC